MKPSRKKLLRDILIPGVIGALALTVIGAVAVKAPSAPAGDGPAAAVKVDTPTGHGSGVHIGNGLFLTAAHVVKDDTAFKVVIGESETDAELLWLSAAYDVALLHADVEPRPPAVSLACAALRVGEAVYAVGNPFDLGVVTLRGTVAADTEERAFWREAALLDMTVGAGMSGGPLFNLAGVLRGLVVGGYGGPISSISVVVPAETICRLLARAP